jgi:hypothetical protein
MSLTIAQVEALAPDQASLNAASKLLRPTSWVSIGRDQSSELIWGECQGSGSAPYRVSATASDLGYRCTCPSRKFPCKHTLALLWRLAENPAAIPVATAPDWVIEWVGKRRPQRKEKEKDADTAASTGGSAAAAREATAIEESGLEVDPAKAAATRERSRQARERSVLAGLDELDRWIGDQLERGLAQFPASARDQCRVVARRLADAKAPGLSTLVDSLPSELFATPETERDRFLIERLGNLHLFAQAYRRQDALPAGLREDVRRIAGWTVKRQDLLANADAHRATGVWITLGVRSEIQPDGLRRVETWLARADAAEPRFGLLLEFLTPGAGTGIGFAPGEAFEGELVFYPSATPLRAIVAARAPLAARPRVAAAESVQHASSRFDRTLAASPFIDLWPLLIGPARVNDGGTRTFVLTDQTGALPIDPDQQDEIIPLVGLADLSLAGVWNGRRFHLLAADTPLGPWYGS